MNSETELPSRVAEEDARLEALLIEGLAGGEDILLTREFWNELASRSGANRRETGFGSATLY